MSSVSHIFFKIANEKDSELEACEYLDLFARKFGFSSETIDEMRLAFIEAIINAKEHAPKDLPNAEHNDIHCTLTYSNDAIEINIRDFGKGFDPTVVEKPDIRKKLKSSYKRGWGLMLMEKLMDGAEISSMPPSGTLIHLVKKKLPVFEANESLIAKKINVDFTVIRTIVKRYKEHGIKSLKHPPKQQNYSANFKMMIIKLVYEGKSKTSLAAEYNLPGPGTIVLWIQKYEELGYNGLISKQGRPKENMNP